MNLFEQVKSEIIGYMPKEYYCHLQFVHLMARELMRTRPCDREVVEVASILHDYGRVPDGDNSSHAEIGSKKAESFLLNLGYDNAITQHISRCILMHNKTEGFATLEEEIIMNADQISKIVYHEAFMLLVKKETFEERARWGIKYLDKGYAHTTFEDVKKKYKHIYLQKREVLQRVLPPEKFFATLN